MEEITCADCTWAKTLNYMIRCKKGYWTCGDRERERMFKADCTAVKDCPRGQPDFTKFINNVCQKSLVGLAENCPDYDGEEL